MNDLSEHFEFEVCSRLIGVIAADFLMLRMPCVHRLISFCDFKFARRRTEMPGISPENSGKPKYVKSEQMDDVATANFLIEEIGGSRHVGEMLQKACKELRLRFPHRSDPENQWTERRLRGWWNKESRIVKHFQMVELYTAAEELREARKEHAEYRAKTAHIRKMAQLVSAHEDSR